MEKKKKKLFEIKPYRSIIYILENGAHLKKTTRLSVWGWIIEKITLTPEIKNIQFGSCISI